MLEVNNGKRVIFELNVLTSQKPPTDDRQTDRVRMQHRRNLVVEMCVFSSGCVCMRVEFSTHSGTTKGFMLSTMGWEGCYSSGLFSCLLI